MLCRQRESACSSTAGLVYVRGIARGSKANYGDGQKRFAIVEVFDSEIAAEGLELFIVTPCP